MYEYRNTTSEARVSESEENSLEWFCPKNLTCRFFEYN
jgi:hypothetical protein